MSIDKENPSRSAKPDLGALLAELRLRREELEVAEPNYEQQANELTKADKGKTAGERSGKESRKALNEGARAIHDRLRRARLDMQETLGDLTLAVGVRAVHDEAARVVLEQLRLLSPYPSVRVADEALALLEELNRSEPRSVGAAPHNRLAALNFATTGQALG